MSAADAPLRGVADAADSGRACPYCRAALEPGLDVMRCAACDSVHHADCWEVNRGCAVVACLGGPATAPEPSPLPPRHAVHGAGGTRHRIVVDDTPSPTRRAGSWLAIAIIVFIVILLIAGAAIALGDTGSVATLGAGWSR